MKTLTFNNNELKLNSEASFPNSLGLDTKLQIAISAYVDDIYKIDNSLDIYRNYEDVLIDCVNKFGNELNVFVFCTVIISKKTTSIIMAAKIKSKFNRINDAIGEYNKIDIKVKRNFIDLGFSKEDFEKYEDAEQRLYLAKEKYSKLYNSINTKISKDESTDS